MLVKKIVTSMKTPGVILDIISKLDGRYDTNYYILKNPNILPKTLARFEKGCLLERIDIARNPKTPFYTLEKLLFDNDSEVLVNLAHNPNIPSCFYNILRENENKSVTWAILENPNCPIEYFVFVVVGRLFPEFILEKQNKIVEQFVLNLKSFIDTLIDKQQFRILSYFVSNINISKDVIAEIARKTVDCSQYDKKIVWEAIAKNIITSSRTLSYLFENSHENSVRYEVAKNSRFYPPKSLENLGDLGLALNISEDTENARVLASLANYEFMNVRENVAKNINTPIDILVKLSNDSSKQVRKAAYKNPNTPFEVKLKFLMRGC